MDPQLEAFDKSAQRVVRRIHNAADQLGSSMVESFIGKLGHPQPGWSALAMDTQAVRILQGYSANEPLLRSGVTRDCFTYEKSVEGTVVVVIAGIKTGTLRELPYDPGRVKDIGQLMAFHERGTVTEPPRPVLPFVVQDITKVLGELVRTGRVSIMTAVR
jgi:hypothetical protein